MCRLKKLFANATSRVPDEDPPFKPAVGFWVDICRSQLRPVETG